MFRGQYLAHCLDRTTFYPGVGEMLTHFAGKRKAVATNKSIEYTNVILQGLGADHFQYVVGGDHGYGMGNRARMVACQPDWFIERPEQLMELFI